RDANGQITGVTYTGGTDSPQVNVGEDATVTPYSSAASNQQYADFVNHLVAMRDALSSASAANVQAAQPGLQTSEDNLLQQVSTTGGVQPRLQGVITQNQDRFTQLENATSKETDANLTQTVVQLTQTQTAYQAALQVGAQVLRVSLLDYLH